MCPNRIKTKYDMYVVTNVHSGASSILCSCGGCGSLDLYNTGASNDGFNSVSADDKGGEKFEKCARFPLPIEIYVFAVKTKAL